MAAKNPNWRTAAKNPSERMAAKNHNARMGDLVKHGMENACSCD